MAGAQAPERDELTVGRLIEDLRSGDSTERWKAAEAISRVGAESPSAVSALVEALLDKTIIVRVGAAEALSRMGEASIPAIPTLIGALADKYATVREIAATALGAIPGEVDVILPALGRAARDENKYVRAEAFASLVKVGARLGAGAIRAVGHSPQLVDADARAGAAIAASSAGASALPGLIALLADESPAVRVAAAEAIATVAPDRDEPAAAMTALLNGQDKFLRDRASAWLQNHRGAAARVEDDAFRVGEPEAIDAQPSPAVDPRSQAALKRWLVPDLIQLGPLESGRRYERLLRLVVPVPCGLSSSVPGISARPETLARGPQEVLLDVLPDGEPGTRRGLINLTTPSRDRSIVVEYEVVSPGNPAAIAQAHRPLAWQPPGWQKILSTPPGSGAHAGMIGGRGVRSQLPARVAHGAGLIDGTRAGAIAPARPIPIEERPLGSKRRRMLRLQRVVMAVIFVGSLAAAAVVLLPRFSGRLGGSIDPLAQPSPGVVDIPATATGRDAPVRRKKDSSNVEINTIGMPLVRVEARRFSMGVDEPEDPSKTPKNWKSLVVEIRHPYLIGQFEVKQKEWNEVMEAGSNPSRFDVEKLRSMDVSSRPGDGSDPGAAVENASTDLREEVDALPVDSVTWLEAVQFCNKLSEIEKLPAYYAVGDSSVSIIDPDGPGYRLPTEAEWECAARAGSDSVWFFGDEPTRLGEFAFFSANSGERTHRVGQKPANSWGLRDTYGNVAEWCWDEEGDYPKEPQADFRTPSPTKLNAHRILRGGAWSTYYDTRPRGRGPYPDDLSSVGRSAAPPLVRDWSNGFRVARTLSVPDRRPGR